MALWRLPRPDFHRLVDTDFQDTLLALRPACLPSRFNDLLHQRLQQSRCLHCCSDCYRVERTSSRAGLTPAVDHHLFTAHPVYQDLRKALKLSAWRNAWLLQFALRLTFQLNPFVGITSHILIDAVLIAVIREAAAGI